MNSRDIINLQEAYLQVYAPQNYSEELEIAADYFYEMGLNEDGVAILVEELGITQFNEWVSDIIDEHYLIERKLTPGETILPARTRKRISGIGPRAFSDPTNPKTAGGKRRAARAAAKEAAEKSEAASQTDTQRKLAAARARVAATKTAQQSQQPSSSGSQEKPSETKRGILGTLRAAGEYAVKRGQADFNQLGANMRALRRSGENIEHRVRGGAEAVRRAAQALRDDPNATRLRRKLHVATTKAARAAGERAQSDLEHTFRAAGGAYGTAKRVSKQGAKPSGVLSVAAGEFAKRLTQREEVEILVNQLLDEGYDLSDYTWDDIYDIYVTEGLKRPNTQRLINQRTKLTKSGKGDQADTMFAVATGMNSPMGRKAARTIARHNKWKGHAKPHLAARDAALADIEKYGFYEDYDIVISHLIDEGYANSIESAEKIMVTMSEEWIDGILEANRGDEYATRNMSPEDAKEYKLRRRNDTRGFDTDAERKSEAAHAEIYRKKYGKLPTPDPNYIGPGQSKRQSDTKSNRGKRTTMVHDIGPGGKSRMIVRTGTPRGGTGNREYTGKYLQKYNNRPGSGGFYDR